MDWLFVRLIAELLWVVRPLELGAGMLARGSGVLAWPYFVTVALLGLLPEYRMLPERSSSGAVMVGPGEPEERMDADELESTTMLPLTAVTCAVPERVTAVPEVARARRAAVE